MMVGNSLVFAIESGITQAYEKLSYRALGYFVIYINGVCYGVRKHDATMLACSFDAVKRRITNRGKHMAVFAELNAGQIVDAFRSAVYSDNQKERYFGITLSDFCQYFNHDAHGVLWAPDGDAAFDDGSYVLQFDVRDRVRLIAFKSHQEYSYDPATLTEALIPAGTFYQVLQEWCELFEAEWKQSQK